MTCESFFQMLSKMSPETRSGLDLMVRQGEGAAKPVTGIKSECDIDEQGNEKNSLILKLAAGKQGPRGPRTPKDAAAPADGTKSAGGAAASKPGVQRPAGSVTA